MKRTGINQIKGYCGLCVARCGTIATVADGRLVRLDPDPDHPTGQALCAKGRAAPELIAAPERLTHPLRRTRPKGDPDPGWERISWDEALAAVAANLRAIAGRLGPEGVAFTWSSPSTTAVAESVPFLRRLMNAFGTPNGGTSLDVCGWARFYATRFTFGTGSVAIGAGGAMPDINNAGCLVLWGYNPSISRLTHATAIVEALKRGMKLIVVDPRQAGLANKADVWLRVRPGTDGALALGLANLMIIRGWFDEEFVRNWTNGPLLVRADTGEVLDLAWNTELAQPVPYDRAIGCYPCDPNHLALDGAFTIEIAGGGVLCNPAFSLYAKLCAAYPLERVAEICWVAPAEVEAAARLLWEARPVAYYAWSGHEQHANATQTARAISLLYALTGSFDVPGGNILLPAVPAAAITGEDLPAARSMPPAVGIDLWPIGPASVGSVTSRDLYRAILDDAPSAIRGLIGFGANLLLSQVGTDRGRAALTKLDFYAHADLFMNPTAEFADIVLPVASCFERDALKIGFEINEAAQSHIQYRQAAVPPPGEARSDTRIMFDIAAALGLAAQFWDGDIDAAWREQLAPTGVTLEELRANPGGVSVKLRTQHRKYADTNAAGVARGFATPSRKVELYSEALRTHGYAALPDFVEPPNSPTSRPDLTARFPLVLTCAKPSLFCQTQHRALPSLRRRAMHPQVQLHPEAAGQRRIAEGDWVTIATPEGRIRARARFNADLDPRVAVGEHGWWQSCAQLGAPGYAPFTDDGANYNRLISDVQVDPVSGTPSQRATLCEISRIEPTEEVAS
jgi:anaerobic selenocysteine-containing dehydrogenase